MSTRLGFPKALLRLGTGRTLLQDTVRKLRRLSDDVLVVANESAYEALGARRVPDRFPGAAALGGICTAIAAARYEQVIVVGCDMPFLSTRLLRLLFDLSSGADAVVPRISGYPEPLHALYSRACIGPIEDQVKAGRYRIASVFDELNVRYVGEAQLRLADPELRSFRNTNDRAALLSAIEVVARFGPSALID